jgi:hypothetical protein
METIFGPRKVLFSDVDENHCVILVAEGFMPRQCEVEMLNKGVYSPLHAIKYNHAWMTSDGYFSH